METLRIRFKPEFGGHEGLLNACDFDESRHIRLDVAPAEPVAPSGQHATDAGDFDETPGSIATVNAAEAKALIKEADTAEALDVLEAAERASIKNPDGRKGVLKAIAARRAELA